MFLNCGVGEDSWESFGLQGDSTSPFWRRSVLGRTDVEAETPILWPPDSKNWLIGKDANAGKDWGQEEKGMTEHEMVGWHHWHNGHGFGWAPGVGDGQGGLACCGSWGHRVGHNWATELNWWTGKLGRLQSVRSQRVDTTEWLNWTELCTLLILCIKEITNENLLCSIGNSTQCSVVT